MNTIDFNTKLENSVTFEQLCLLRNEVNAPRFIGVVKDKIRKILNDSSDWNYDKIYTTNLKRYGGSHYADSISRISTSERSKLFPPKENIIVYVLNNISSGKAFAGTVEIFWKIDSIK